MVLAGIVGPCLEERYRHYPTIQIETSFSFDNTVERIIATLRNDSRATSAVRSDNEYECFRVRVANALDPARGFGTAGPNQATSYLALAAR